jgi:hypothetical protein
MRVDRLAIDSGKGTTFTLDLHPRLTVVAGMGRAERESLLGELVGALGGSRPGVHVELTTSDGRHLAAFRPYEGRAAVVDVDAARDVSDEHRRADGRLDLLGRFGLDVASARDLVRCTAADLTAAGHCDELVSTLAGADQHQLWAAATELGRTQDELSSEAEAVGSAPEDADLIEEVENRHAALESAAEQFDSIRRRTFVIGGSAGVLTLPTVVTVGAAGLGFAAVAVLGTLASVVAWRRMVRAQKAEQRVLDLAGAQSYLAFQVQRVNGLLGDDQRRRRLMAAADTRRRALTTWQRLAGDIPVEWALERRDEIEAAARLRQGLGMLGSMSATGPGQVTDAATGATEDADDLDDLARALVDRLGAVRAVAGEGLPLVLDQPFDGVAPAVKPLLLELLGRSAGDPQLVLLTDDEDVASWARLEALTGDVAVIEPAVEHDRSPLGPTASR